jgi:glycerol-3-phosphate dehydrogenase
MAYCRRSFLDQKFDVIVIGGGISGVAIARECAQRGLRTLILEKNDFCAGTTSRSTRIVHGCLRHLEHGEISQARDYLRERDYLLQHSQQLVKPVQFLLAVQGDTAPRLGSALALRTALWVHRAVARRVKQKEQRATSAEAKVFESNLDSGRTWKTYFYEDAQCEFPERIVAEWLVRAIAVGAEALNHVEALRIHRLFGHVSEVRVRDGLTQEEGVIGAKWVVNATGPWLDQIVSGSNISTPRMVHGMRGTHLVLPDFLTAPKRLIETRGANGDSFFLTPWNGQLLAGSTAVADSGNPDLSEPARAEIEYLMSCVTTLFPGSGLTKADIRYAYSGIRPLSSAPNGKNPWLASNPKIHHHREEGATGFISVAGGTLNTAATTAREVTRMMGLPDAKEERTLAVAGTEEDVEANLQQWTHLVAARAKVPNQVAHALSEWYGWQAMAIAQIASLDASLREPLCDHTLHIAAEAVHAFRHECAATLADVLLRRVPVALGACWSAVCSQTAAQKIGLALGWSPAETARQLESLEEERLSFLHPSLAAWQPVSQAPVLETRRVRADPRMGEAPDGAADILPSRDAA